MGATNLETHMRKYSGEACDGGYVVVPMHALYDGSGGVLNQASESDETCN